MHWNSEKNYAKDSKCFDTDEKRDVENLAIVVYAATIPLMFFSINFNMSIIEFFISQEPPA